MSLPTAKLCTTVYLDPGYAYHPPEEERFNQTKRVCEPEYQLDRAAFHKAYIQGEHDRRVAELSSYCSCEVGYLTGYRHSDKEPFNPAKILNDPLYKCDNKNGKSEFERGLSLGIKYAQYVKENKWSFKPIYHPDDAAIKKACIN